MKRAASSRKLVAVVVPLSLNPALTPAEELSIQHLEHYLGGYDRYLIAPRGVSIQRRGFQVRHLPRKFFGSKAAYNRLMMWPPLYRAFEDYQYILVYQLDCLVLSDQLAHWCGAGWDYIGAPWVPCDDTPWVKQAHVGNGGFSLMKVSSVLQVLANRYRQKPMSYWTDMVLRNSDYAGPLVRALEAAHRVLPGSTILARCARMWRVSEHPAEHGENNDRFWSVQAVRYLSSFKVAPVDDGLRFAFEAAPRLCFELSGRQMPFGCHAWEKFDRAFWEPHLLSAGAGGLSATDV